MSADVLHAQECAVQTALADADVYEGTDWALAGKVALESLLEAWDD